MLPPFLVVVGFITAVGAAPATPLAVGRALFPAQAQTAAPAQRQLTSRVNVIVPADDAVLTVNGSEMSDVGTSRTFSTAPLAAGTQKFTFSVTWNPNTYTTITRSKVVEFRAGETVRVDLSVEDPEDRVRVIYVPTPPDITQAMVDLASVTSTDVVYEPGCGDARITIAALRAGARRGICVDIDPDRARESKANVQAAGYADRIDVREGDALDVKNLSDVSVVMLYMGDHFDMLIRPVLWRELKVGSRIVSHRFKMGDWEPDETISVTSDQGIPFELHLWTITEEIKRRQTQAR